MFKVQEYCCACKHYALTKSSATEDRRYVLQNKLVNIELHKNVDRFAEAWKACKDPWTMTPDLPLNQGNTGLTVIRYYYIHGEGCATLVWIYVPLTNKCTCIYMSMEQICRE